MQSEFIKLSDEDMMRINELDREYSGKRVMPSTILGIILLALHIFEKRNK